METKLILVEGIPGSGKTTVAKRIKEFLEAQNIEAALFCEGDVHPADLSWCSYLSIDEYNNIIYRYPQYSEVIKQNTVLEDEYAVVAYTKLGFYPSENELMKYFEDHEVYDGRVPLERFSKIHFQRWGRFADNAAAKNEISIFECAYFQSHICELMGTHVADTDYISDHLISLIETVQKLNPVIIYLTQPDIGQTIARVAKERVSPDKSHSDWIDLVIAWVEKSNFGRMHGLTGFDGAIRFFEDRKSIELDTLCKLPINKFIIENPEYDWDEVFTKVKEILASLGVATTTKTDILAY